MTPVECQHRNTTKLESLELEIDGVVFDIFGEHEICLDCQSHIDCPPSCKEHTKYLRTKGLEPDRELPF